MVGVGRHMLECCLKVCLNEYTEEQEQSETHKLQEPQVPGNELGWDKGCSGFQHGHCQIFCVQYSSPTCAAFYPAIRRLWVPDTFNTHSHPRIEFRNTA
jgi:hypothetical protein